MSGKSVGKIIIILSLRVGKTKNRNIDHRRKESYAKESDHIFFCCDSTISSALNFCFLYTLLQPKRKISY